MFENTIAYAFFVKNETMLSSHKAKSVKISVIDTPNCHLKMHRPIITISIDKIVLKPLYDLKNAFIGLNLRKFSYRDFSLFQSNLCPKLKDLKAYLGGIFATRGLSLVTMPSSFLNSACMFL